ncbi:MAG TPA: neutral zinc metallopeptidase, partial [Pyrinomonadaceae bacterium]
MLRGRESSNIEDVRGMGGRGIALGGGGIGMLILALVIYLCGGDPRALLENLPGQGQAPTQQQQPQQGPNNQRANDDQRSFAASVLGSTEDVWNKVLPEQARTRYREPKLVLFTDQVSSACGVAGSSTGPFYCPGDEKLYLDFSFFRDLRSEFKAPGDFAQAYVIAHEVGHHVQNILGTMDKVNAAGNNNQLSVRLELQADCYAGVWAYYAQKQGLV